MFITFKKVFLPLFNQTLEFINIFVNEISFVLNSGTVKRFFIYFLIFSYALLPGCSTDLDVTGDYQETMVVYGLLDQSQPKQYIKVNKAFLGKGDALLFAKIKDSVQFVNALDVRLKRLSDGKEYILTPDNTIQKAEGAFYSGDQANAIYSCNSTGINALNANSNYSLSIVNKTNGNTVTANTALINDFQITKPFSPTNSTSFIFTPPSESTRLFVEWLSSKNSRLFQLIVRLNYEDYTENNGVKDTVEHQLDWVFPVRTTADANGNEAIGNDFSRVEYLSYIGNNLKSYSGLVARRAINIHLIVVAGGPELNTFMEVNKPSGGLVQDKPIYTNIDNGYGVLSSRYYKPPFILTLVNSTPGKELDSLACGRFTKKLKFLNASGVLPGCL